MESEIRVTKLTHDDLVNILSTALYANDIIGASYNNKIYESLENTNGHCFEDKLADMLLAGHSIRFYDYEAYGESHSDKCIGFEDDYDEDSIGVYEVCLQDFLDTASTKEGYRLVNEAISGEGDYYIAFNFLQRLLFGEEIYG